MIGIENMWQEMKIRVMDPKTNQLDLYYGFCQRSLGKQSNENVPEAWENLLESSRNSLKNKAYAIYYLTRK